MDFDIHPITANLPSRVLSSWIPDSVSRLNRRWKATGFRRCRAFRIRERRRTAVRWAQASLAWHGVSTQCDDDRNVFQLAEASNWICG
jgi:hypothetical protein